MNCPNCSVTLIHEKNRNTIGCPYTDDVVAGTADECVGLTDAQRVRGRSRFDKKNSIGVDLLGCDETVEVGPTVAQPCSEAVFKPRELRQNIAAIHVVFV